MMSKNNKQPTSTATIANEIPPGSNEKEDTGNSRHGLLNRTSQCWRKLATKMIDLHLAESSA